MTTLFAQTIARAISDYRHFLRKYLKQSERVQKLNELNLKSPALYQSEVLLFETGWRIVKDIEQNIKIPEQNYYSYSGIAKFCDFLRDYLSNFEVEDGKITHRAQKASREMIEAIQLISLSNRQLTEDLVKSLHACHEVIANYGSPEQHELYVSTLEQHRKNDEVFYAPIIDDIKLRIKQLVRDGVREAV